jgi:signal transduction histidine kinase
VIENELRVSVTDNGIGIPDDQKKRIFERYAQLGNKDRQGLGLGLYISTILVEAHHGKLSVESVPGISYWFSSSGFFYWFSSSSEGDVANP